MHKLAVFINVRYLIRLYGMFILLMAITSNAQAQTEEILRYHTVIEVHTDRSITVTEDIDVRVLGDRIKRGLTRRLPTKRNLNDREMKVNYEILDIQKNGQPEPYHEEGGGDLMLYLGSKDVLLDPGTYAYRIKYHVPDQIGIWDDYDEIYWNAIGADVEFPIREVSCEVVLPSGVEVVQESAYVGTYRAQERAYVRSIEDNVVQYQTTRSLKPREAFTVSVAFPKGVVNQPGLLDRLGALLLVILSTIFLLPYYVYTWWKHGQDPPSPTPYPLWNPPDDLSPGSLKYVLKGRYDSKIFTASIVHLAITGHLKIDEVEEKGFFSKSRSYELIKLKEADEHLPKEERDLMQSLFRSVDRISIGKEYDPDIESSFSGHEGSLSYQHSAFINEGNNTKLIWLPALATVVSIALAILVLVKSNYATSANLTALFAFVPLAVGGLILFGYLIKKPTHEKLELRSRIKGYKMYLELAEKDRLRLLNPPEMTPDHFEKVLPYAFALGVEHSWTSKFKSILEQAKYRPNWNNSTNMVYFSSHFGRDFSESISTAATKPSDSGSGSGGGGFSGGGGGGGGVGGW